MEKNISINIISGMSTVGLLNATSKAGGNDKNENGLSSLTVGQKVIGKVVDMKDQITFEFHGVQINVPKDMISGIELGDSRLFEVMKVTEQIIELKEAQEEAVEEKKQACTSTIRVDKDQEVYKAQKEYTDRHFEIEKQVQDVQNKMNEITSKLTELDYKNLEKEGISLDQFSVDSLHTALNRIKEKNTSDFNSNQKASKLNLTEEEIEKRLKDANLPATKEAMQNITAALALSDIAAKMNDNTKQYLISNRLEPTIENVYKAYYNGNANTKKIDAVLSEDAWSQLQPQAAHIIEGAGYEVNQENLMDAKWLIENELPLDVSNFTYKKDLQEIKDQWDKDAVFDKVIDGMKEGRAPKDVSLLQDREPSYEQIVKNVQAIKDETVASAVKNNTKLTIHDLNKLQEESSTTDVQEEEVVSQNGRDLSYEAIKAQRQLEEIRLKMTVEAAAKLEKKGFHIETEQLEKVVEELRQLEEQYYKELCNEAQLEANDENLRILTETTQSMSQLKTLPSFVLGVTLPDRRVQTIPDLVQSGTRMQNELAKAGEAYETLMTVPNREYGDSIHKAFQNMASLLDEMNIENTQMNQRAVRILAYNRMEITQDSIDQMKAYDSEVNALIDNLNPAIAVRLIKDGLNPLHTPITELNETIDRLKEEQGISSEDKYSVYLRKLEKSEAISEEERKAYIGIYRLLYNIEKSDGAAVGALIKANREITLDHLLSAVQTLKKGSLDTVINDEFGLLQELTHSKETISKQLEAVFTDKTAPEDKQEEDIIKDQTELFQRLLNQMKDEITPDKLVTYQTSQEQGIWDSIKDMPVEKLLEQIQQLQDQTLAEDEIYTEKVQLLRESYKKADHTIRFLDDLKLPSTPVNIMMANHLLNNGESGIKKLLKQYENIVENSETALKENSEIADKLINKSSMNEVYENLVNIAKDTLEQACSKETIDSTKLAELKMIGTQMTFLKSLADKEYYQIPIDTEQGVINMNLTVIRGVNSTGRVSVSVQSEHMGNVKADMTLKEHSLKGFVYCEGRKGLDILKQQFAEMEDSLKQEGITVKQMDFGLRMKDKDQIEYPYIERDTNDVKPSSNNEKELYKIAKAFVKMIQKVQGLMEEK